MKHRKQGNQCNDKTKRAKFCLAVVSIIFALSAAISIAYSNSTANAEKRIEFVKISEYNAPDGLILNSQRKDAEACILFRYDTEKGEPSVAEEYHAVMHYDDMFGTTCKYDLYEFGNNIEQSIEKAIKMKNNGRIINTDENSEWTKKIIMHLPREAKETVENTGL